MSAKSLDEMEGHELITFDGPGAFDVFKPPEGLPTQCEQCVHYRGEKSCKAYPRGVPEPIWQGKADHRREYAGDGGFRWIARKIKEAA